MGFTDQHLMEPLRALRLLANPMHLQLIHALKIKANAAFLAIDLKAVGVLVAARIACGLQRAQRPILKFDRRRKSIVHVHRLRFTADTGAGFDECADRGRHPARLTYQIAPQINNVRAKVSQRPAAGNGFVQPPDVRRVVVRHDPLLQIHRAKVVDLPQLPVSN